MHVNPHVLAPQVVVAFARAGQTLPHAPQLDTSADVFSSQPSAAIPLQFPKGAVHENPHVLAMHVVAAFARAGHATPHAPQFVRLVDVFASHPSAATPLQSANGARHVNPHVPPVQLTTAFALAGHAFPQAPQWLVLVDEFTSQPSTGTPLQSRKLPRHAKPHAPPEQLVVAFARAGHALPQDPQLETSAVVFASQPSAATPLQLPKPPEHVKPHAPPEQFVVAFARAGHTTPHDPQLLALLDVLTSQPSAATALQSPKGATHANPHTLLVQFTTAFGRAGHVVPHAPQLLGLLDVLTSQPLTAAPSQSRNVPVQAKPHVLPAQLVVAFARAGHAFPHAPQLLASLDVLASQPSAGAPLQFPNPARHANPHVPAAQLAVAFARAGHAVPHAPQFDALLDVSASHPSAATPLQLPKGARHANPHAPPMQFESAFARAGHEAPQAPQ